MNYTIEINQLAGETYFPELDIIDLAIYDYLLKFYPSAEKYNDSLGTWIWISHNKLILDMPKLKIKSKAGIIKRINNLIDSEIIIRHPNSINLNRSYYKIGPKWDLLIKFIPPQQKSRGHNNENQEVPNNENQENNNTNIDHNTKDNIYSKIYSKDPEVNKAFVEYLQMRKKKKLDNTERIINRLLKKLHEYASNRKEALEIIEKAITSCWKDFYPIKESKEIISASKSYQNLENYKSGYDR
jgi:hypothetical protein